MGGTHSHDADADWNPSVPVARILAICAVAVALVAVVGLVIWWPSGSADVRVDDLFADRVTGVVESARIEPCSYDPESRCDQIQVRITSGEGDGDNAVLEFGIESAVPVNTLQAGDEIVPRRCRSPPRSRPTW